MIRLISLFAAGLLMAATTAVAKKPVEQIIVIDTPEDFAILVDKIRSEMAPGKRFEFLSTNNRKIVDQSLDLIASMLADDGSVDAMDRNEKVRVTNELEKVNALLAQNADDRLVCSYENPIGSHIPVKKSYTARQLENNRREGRRQLDQTNRNSRVTGRSN